jgi:hypothetical protein
MHSLASGKQVPSVPDGKRAAKMKGFSTEGRKKESEKG